MARHNQSPIRDQARTEILAALEGGQTMTVAQIFDLCPTASDRGDVARLCFDMTRNGSLVKGSPTLNAQNKAVNTYRLGQSYPSDADPIPPEECLDQELIEAISQLKEEDEIMTKETANYMTPEEEECMSEALAKDEDIEADAAIEASRLAIVDAMLAYAHDELRGNRVWIALAQAYQAVSGDNLGSRHG